MTKFLMQVEREWKVICHFYLSKRSFKQYFYTIKTCLQIGETQKLIIYHVFLFSVIFIYYFMGINS
jgi:hypothetical protein